MKKKKYSIKEFKELIKELKKHNFLYFNQDEPLITDAEYDALKKKLIQIEKSDKSLKKLDLLNNIVGSPPSSKFKKIPHLKPMLSLSNAFSKNDIIDFIKKIKIF